MKRLSSARGGIKGMFLLVILDIALLWGSGQGLYTAVTNRRPAVFGCADFLQQAPEQKWLLLKECRLNVVRASYSKLRLVDTVTQVYIPISATTSVGDVKTKALFATKDESVIALVTEMQKVKDEH